MCTPQLALGMQAAGAGQAAVGAFLGASAEKRNLYGQARMAEISARVADANARNAIYAGTVEESRIKLLGSQAKGSTIARFGASGVDIASSPTALARLTGDDLITFVDANTARTNALRAAWGHRFDAGNARRTATSQRASAAGISPLMAGATSLINSAGQVAQSWYTMNKEGAFDAAPRTGQAHVEDDLLTNWPTLGGQGDYRSSRRGLDYGRGY